MDVLKINDDDDDDDDDISETIRTTEMSFAPFGSVTFDLGHGENGTRISLTVSEIFDGKHIALNAIFLYSSSYYYYSIFLPNSLAKYLLLQEWSHP